MNDAMFISIIRLVKPDPRDPAPLHEQVAAALRRAVAEGDYTVGERLPTTRDLAAALDVDPNTVLRSLRRLRDEGLLDFRRGRGITVAAVANKRGEIIQEARLLLRLASRHGISREELVQIIEEVQ